MGGISSMNGYQHLIGGAAAGADLFLLSKKLPGMPEFLPSFVTDVAMQRYGGSSNRKIVTILDKEAKANYYAVCLKTSEYKIQQLVLY